MLPFEQGVGSGYEALAGLLRVLQERLLQEAVGGNEQFRQQLAIHLHGHQPRTAHSPKPTAVA
jgi:hypothetical protein